jgi:hypothetical protein
MMSAGMSQNNVERVNVEILKLQQYPLPLEQNYQAKKQLVDALVNSNDSPPV